MGFAQSKAATAALITESSGETTRNRNDHGNRVVRPPHPPFQLGIDGPPAREQGEVVRLATTTASTDVPATTCDRDSAICGSSSSSPRTQASTFFNSDDDQSQPGESLPSRLKANTQSSRRFSTGALTEMTYPFSGPPVLRRSSVYNESSLRIVDPSLIKAFSQGADGPGDDTGLDHHGMFLPPTASIHEPFQYFFYNRKRIMQFGNHGDEDTRKNAQVLLDFMQDECATTWTKALEVENKTCQTIAFEDSWLLYHPNETVFRMDEGGWRAYKVSRAEIGRRRSLDPIRIYAYHVDFDKSGTMLVPHLATFTVSPYPSEQPIGNLEVIPEWYIRENAPQLRERLAGRGERYWGYGGKPIYCEYRGDAWPTTMDNKSSKVMIDHVTSSKHDSEVCATTQQPSNSRQCSVCLGEALQLGPYFEGTCSHDANACILKDDMAQNSKADDSCLLYCPSMVWAFSLRHKTWALVRVNDIFDLERETQAWKELQMGKSKVHLEDIVTSFFDIKPDVGGASEPPVAKPNVVSDKRIKKGRGFNVHLHGGPGTGKSYAAECLSSKYLVPLYQIACGILGTEPTALDKHLELVTLRAANWGAILMFDDADVYVQEQENLDNLERKALVSTFRSHLGRSEALIFFATNSHARPDPAFASHMHFALSFPKLTLAQQQNIWCAQLGQMGLSKANLGILCEFIRDRLETMKSDDGWHLNLNGRQIQNCLGAAVAIAKRDRDKDDVDSLQEHHIERVITRGNEFRAFVRRFSECGYGDGLVVNLTSDLPAGS